jgi:hypothetical protein
MRRVCILPVFIFNKTADGDDVRRWSRKAAVVDGAVGLVSISICVMVFGGVVVGRVSDITRYPHASLTLLLQMERRSERKGMVS